MTLFGTAGIRGDATERVTPELALAVGRAVGVDAANAHEAGGDAHGEGGDRDRDRNPDRDRSSDADDEGSERDGRRSVGDDADGKDTGGDRVRSFAGSAGTDGVVIARDGRVTGPALAAALEAGIESAGARVYRAGRLPTPALAYASRGRWGVMITASHNPPADNGIKCFSNGEEVDRAIEERIEERIAEGIGPAAWNEWETSEAVDPLVRYRKAVAAYARGHGAALEGLTVAVDCANGVSGFATPQVLRALGAEVLALGANVDGFFPGRESKPTEESLADLRAFVADRSDDDTGEGEAGSANEGEDGSGRAGRNDRETRGIDLAIAHDGDGDRVVVLDGDGEIIHEDTIVAILAEHYVRASDADDPVVVTTPNASSRIDERVLAAGGRIECVRLGALHEGIAAAIENGSAETEVAFAAEPWKHIHTSLGPWIDGVASAAVLARLVADRGLPLLRGPVTERPYEKSEVRCPDRAKEAAMQRLETSLPEAFPDAAVTTGHGVRLDLGVDDGSEDGRTEIDAASDDAGDASNGDDGGGWVLVRPSGTEPYLRLYVEHEAVGDVLDRVRETIETAVTETETE
jgi:phosphomannomutase